MPDYGTTIIERRRPEAPSEATVSTARCIAYNAPQVRKAVRQCVEALPDMQELLGGGKSVLLKPNLLSTRYGPENHINTHPAVVFALAELLIQEFGCAVAIGDSCGSLTHGSTAKAITVSRMDQVAATIGARIYNVDTQPRHVVHFKEGRVYREIPLPSNLDQFDLIISVAKLKTHSLTLSLIHI